MRRPHLLMRCRGRANHGLGAGHQQIFRPGVLRHGQLLADVGAESGPVVGGVLDAIVRGHPDAQASFVVGRGSDWCCRQQ